MPMGQRDNLLDHLRRFALHAAGDRRTDGQLLECFLLHREEAAFDVLLRRHGPMVRGVCLRILGNLHDADDAFQATFLVLVRRAASVWPREAVGCFLHGVAQRTARELRKRRARQRTREAALPDLSVPASEPGDHELRTLLDREVNRLADKYRLPVVLCELEGRSRKEVAAQLAIPEGTLSSRLATARKKLAARLVRYGLAVTATALAAQLSESAAPAAVPSTLSLATTKAALLTATGPAAGLVSTTVLTLTEGVVKAMFLAKVKTATVVLCGVAVLGLGAGGAVYQTRVGAADSSRVDRGIKERHQREKEASANKEDWRKIAEEARAREEKLQKELARLHAEMAQMKLEAQVELTKAASEHQRAERELKEARQLLKEMHDAKAASAPKRQIDANKPTERKDDLDWQLQKVEQEKEQIAIYFKREMAGLEARQKELKTQQEQLQEGAQKQLAKLEKMRVEIMYKKTANQQNPNVGQRRGGGDKLDQILQRLERLEKRLDRLEQGRR